MHFVSNISARAGRLSRRIWDWLRAVMGDDAYDVYLAHRHRRHAEDGGEPLSRREFHRKREDERWNGVNRCC